MIDWNAVWFFILGAIILNVVGSIFGYDGVFVVLFLIVIITIKKEGKNAK